ncbi:hypothetical protein [Parahaliea mediterranea]|uniref:hypothetical protein n=1 Tax=Parahaliea mediterranea TaxID=651086 RepID=UPI0013001A08|nr:hypothetical protein [Parahaliea mediterranea]
MEMTKNESSGSSLIFRHGILFVIFLVISTNLWLLHILLGSENLASLFVGTVFTIFAFHFLCMCAFDRAYQHGILSPVSLSTPGSNKPYAFILPAVLTSCFLVSAHSYYLETGTQDFVNLTGAGLGLVMLILFDAKIYRNETKTGGAATQN